MNTLAIKELLELVARGDTSVDEAAAKLADLPFESLGYATVDHHRELRTGFPEVVYGAGKTKDQISGIVRSIRRQGQNALVTRVSVDVAEEVRAELSDADQTNTVIDPVAQLLFVGEVRKGECRGRVAVVSAGTSDLPVAEEAAKTLEFFGNEVFRVCDVGVAGLHRLLPFRNKLEECEVVIVVAGMEGALPSVLGGLLSRPMIAVPTSVGHGTNFGGVTALLSMLNSCSSGITVVNIDNGFGAAYAASLINRKREV